MWPSDVVIKASAQRAALAVAEDSHAADIARDIRRRQQVLHNPASLEGAGH